MDTQRDPAAGRVMRPPKAPPCAMVIFGASGDLTKRLLMPALYNLARAGRLSDKFALIGVDRSEKSHEDFREDLADGVRRFVSDTAEASVAEPFDAKTWGFLAERMTHVDGNVLQPELYRRLAEALKAIETEHGTGGNVIFYLAVASSLFGPVIDGLAASGLTDETNGRWRRVIIEKPFGTDLASARALDARILRVLSESQIYRMDHFLGKETVQNIMVLRFANGIFEPLWNRDHIDHVQITVAETVGVERRAAFYEATGALRRSRSSSSGCRSRCFAIRRSTRFPRMSWSCRSSRMKGYRCNSERRSPVRRSTLAVCAWIFAIATTSTPIRAPDTKPWSMTA